ncbi:MAG: signal peptide peptidase SppA [Anaerolineae bacterium]|nr:signal peptide peptidase SppA [Anaerolineae bacterium]
MLKAIRNTLKRVNPLRAIQLLWFKFGNWRRGRAKVDYITFLLPAEIPHLAEPRDWIRRRILGAPPLSLTELERIFERIGNDPRPKGVILYMRGLAMPQANLQTLRGSILRLREQGKKVICFAQGYSNAVYYVASAADEIVLQPGGEVETVGLRLQATFLKDAFDMVGIRLDSVAISPFKGAYDSFTRNDMSPEGRAQYEWLLDSQFGMIVQGIAEGRKISPEAVWAMIDGAPYLDESALAAGYVDAVLTEEDLHRRLESEQILSWSEANKKLLHKWRQPSEKYVALLKVSGLMMPGESGKPPVDLPIPFIGGERSGDSTVVQQVRSLMKNKAAAAVILYIDSGGGAAIAAEAMTSALRELAKDRPLVVYMNGVAASGGYYIATPAQWIVAQPGTITGSIGVIGAKVVTSGLFEKAQINRVELVRGANAALNSDQAPYTDEQRTRVFKSIEHVYHQFIQHVADGRKMTVEAVDAVGGGRVWTGVQAKEHGLVDELGDLRAALKKARELADLPDHAPLIMIDGKQKPLPAQLAESSNPAAALQYLQTNLQVIASGTPQMMLPVMLVQR